MKISSVKLHNFRSYELAEFNIGERGTVIVGPNGTGKTNLLEAVYVALRGSSFRGSLVDCIKINTEQATVLVETDEQTRRVQILRSNTSASKTFTINDHKSKALLRKHRLPVILFEPNELRLISSSPTRRRDFLDDLVSRLDEEYERTLRALNRALLQRNELLKKHIENSVAWRDHLFAWDVKFIQLASKIATSRAAFLYTHEAQLANLYASLAGKITPFKIEYLPSVAIENYEQLLFDRLARSRDYEIATGHTSSGPHREDFLVSLNGQLASKSASRGEMRTIMLAFKFLELELQTAKSDVKPIVLLDDVFSELDATREKLLQETINNYQFIVTTTDARHQSDNGVVVSTTKNN